jgi:hypothetical protein
MAASLAARLRSECDADVATLAGGIGEFTVLVEGQEVVKARRLWYPRLEDVFQTVRARLAV